MTDQPILFSKPMVCALLSGRKTQTRRILTRLRGMGRISELNRSLANCQWEFRRQDMCWNDVTHQQMLALLKYKVGDRLWVKETWFHLNDQGDDCVAERLEHGQTSPPVGYVADVVGNIQQRKKPSIYMPRWASRLTLIVTDVRVEQLQKISEADAIKEGIERDVDYWRDYEFPSTQCCVSPVDSFRTLWDSINGKRGNAAWDANPWVVALTFNVAPANIDQELRP
jgi:hypothetical protein